MTSDNTTFQLRTLWWLGIVLIASSLLYLLSPILMPFLVSALIAYLGDPLVDRLERKMSRGMAVTVVFLVILLVLLLILLLLVPALQRQVLTFIERLPTYVDWGQTHVLPLISGGLGVESNELLDTQQLKSALSMYWKEAGGIAGTVLKTLSQSGAALAQWLGNLVLIPVVSFYLLRDWDVLMAHIHHALPRRMEARIVSLAKESDEVLGAFLRGQFLVMSALATVYAIGLWIVGIELALFFGLLAGFVSFVPYLGFIIGVLAAGGAALVQFQEITPLLGVLAVFGVGQLLESFLLTPWLVGDRIGLHPVAVIFAVLAGGQLFGFVGVLIGLPVAAVVMVLLRHAHERYMKSNLYGPAETAPEQPQDDGG